jgi:hypothetical protein
MSDTIVHFRPKNQFDLRRKSPMTMCGKYYFDVSKWTEEEREVTCAECNAAMRIERES